MKFKVEERNLLSPSPVMGNFPYLSTRESFPVLYFCRFVVVFLMVHPLLFLPKLMVLDYYDISIGLAFDECISKSQRPFYYTIFAYIKRIYTSEISNVTQLL